MLHVLLPRSLPVPHQRGRRRPWDVMMMLFSELYTMLVPLFVPDRHWLALAQASFRHAAVCCFLTKRADSGERHAMVA